MPDVFDGPDPRPGDDRGRDFEAEFDDIVSHWDEVREPVRPKPRSNPAPQGPATSPEPSEPDRPRSPSGYVIPQTPDEGTPQQHFGHRAYTVPEVEEDFVPPPPAPMPDAESDPQFWAIVICLVVGPLLLILLVVTGRSSMTVLMVIAGLMTLTGLGLAVARGSHEPRDPGDDGARV